MGASSKFYAKLRGYGKELLHRIRTRIAFRNIESKNPALVYQMGKVGSSTVVRTLEGMKMTGPVVHVHSLAPENVSGNVETLRANPGYLHRHVVTSLTLTNKKLKWGHFPCKIITLTREPVGRAISFAFEDWRRQLSDVWSLQELEPEKMIELVLEKLRPGSPHANPEQWFDRELRSVFDIDLMSVPYDFEQGYVTFCRGPVDVLVIRMEDLNRALKSGLADLLDVEERDIQMRRSNVGKDKKYADLLAEVKERMTIPSSVSERIWSTDYAQHFYGPDIDHLREKWEEAS